MKEIQLTQGKVAYVDDCDFEMVNKYKWTFVKSGNGRCYATRGMERNGIKTTCYMHRMIMGFPEGKVIDHIDHDGLNNTRGNLRICTQSENCCNSRLYKNNKSGFPGVWQHESGKWRARVIMNRKNFYLGYFDTFEEAVEARVKASLEIQKEFSIHARIDYAIE